MKTVAAFAIAVLCAASASASDVRPLTAVKAGSKATVTTCTTAGDALGSVRIDVIGNTIFMLETGMDGNTTRNKLEQGGPDLSSAIAALRNGTPVNLWYRSVGATEFGGAVMKAGLIAFGSKMRNGTRSAYLSRRDIVYMLTCKP